MNVKLTLTLEEHIIEKAKIYAKKKGRSLSDIVENFLKSITTENENEAIEITPLVKSLKGSFKAPPDFDYKEELAKAISEKHL